MREKSKRIPIAKCPNLNCGRTLLYSCNPKDEYNIEINIADENYVEKMMCYKYKTFVAIIEKPKVAHGYVAIPIIKAV